MSMSLLSMRSIVRVPEQQSSIFNGALRKRVPSMSMQFLYCLVCQFQFNEEDRCSDERRRCAGHERGHQGRRPAGAYLGHGRHRLPQGMGRPRPQSFHSPDPAFCQQHRPYGRHHAPHMPVSGFQGRRVYRAGCQASRGGSRRGTGGHRRGRLFPCGTGPE